MGYGVSPGSVPEMKAALEKVVANYQEISNICINKAKQLNWTNIAESYFEIYRSVL